MAFARTAVNFYKVPVANVIYDTFFDEPPSMDQVNALLSTFSLLNGLLLAVAAAVMNIFSPGDAQEVSKQMQVWAEDDGFRELLAKCPSSLPCDNAYEDFLLTSNFAFVSLGSAVLSLVLTFIFTAAINFDARRDGSQADGGSFDAKSYAAWWNVVRWLLLIMVVMTALGVYATIVSVQAGWVVQHGHSPQKIRDLTNTCIALDIALLAVLGVAVPVLLMSAALINREQAAGRILLKKVASVEYENRTEGTLP